MTLPAGTLLGAYRIERPIGTGAFATVYRAHDDRLDATVAIKMLAENRALDLDARRRFVEEAQALRRVRTPSVVSVYDIGESDTGQPYMVLEYAAGGDLAGRFAALGRTADYPELYGVAAFLRRSLGALHQVDLIHRDVKPQNILLGDQRDGGAPAPEPLLVNHTERLILGDLGFVKDLSLASGLTAGGGTWAFQAPEQRQRIGTVDRRADVYGATAVILWLQTGYIPVEPASWLDQLDNNPLADVLAKGLAENPDDRHADINTWYAELSTRLAPTTPKGVSTPRAREADTNVDVAAQRPRRWGRTAAAIAAALALGAGGFAVGSALDNDDPVTIGSTIVTADQARTTARVGGFDVAIAGPATVRVGEPATFTATVDEAVTAHWVYPDGSLITPGSGVSYTAATPGAFSVTLLVVAPGHDPQLLVHEAIAEA